MTSWNDAAGEIFQARGSFGITQEELGSENDERFADAAAIFAAVHLAAQEMEILRGRCAVANLHIVFGAELQEAFDAGAGMFGPLAFEAMRKQQNEAAGLVPFRFGRDEELIDDDLGAVDEIAELGFPHDQSERIGDAVAEFKTHHGKFAEQDYRWLRTWPDLVLGF